MACYILWCFQSFYENKFVYGNLCNVVYMAFSLRGGCVIYRVIMSLNEMIFFGVIFSSF